MRKIIFPSLLFLLLSLPLVVFAQTSAFPQNISVAKDEVINDNYIRAANTIDINGTINGDAIMAANTITINGNVAGDVIAAASVININGEVGGNVRVAAMTIQINNKIGRNLNAFGNTVTLTKNASVGWGLVFAGSQIKIDSPVGGKIWGIGSQVTLTNSVGTNFDVNLGEEGLLTLTSEAIIKGDLNYSGTKDAVIQKGAQVMGETTHKPIPVQLSKAEKFFSRNWIFFRVIGLFGILLVGVVIISFAKDKTKKITSVMWQQPAKLMLFGLIYLIVIPIALVLLIFTIIGGPLSLIGLCLYLIAVYIARIFTSTLIGQKILGYINKKKLETQPNEGNLLWSMILGTFILYILISLPYIGWLIGLIAVIWALGGLGEVLKKKKDAEVK